MSRTPKSSRRAAFAVAALAAGIAAAGPASAQEVKIGALLPLTGDLQAFGGASQNGIELAVNQVNADGGVLGGDVGLEVSDAQTTPQIAIDAAKKLISVAGVAGIVGAMSSGVTIPVAKTVTSQEGVPQISNASTSPLITNLDDNGFLFRTVPSDAFQGVALSQVANENGLEKVAVMYINNDYGEGLADSFQQAFEAAGGAVTARAAYEKGKASYRSELQGLSGDGAEALLLIGYPQNGITILRQALEEGFFDRFVFTDGMKAPEVVEAIGAEYLNGSFGTAPSAKQDTNAYKNFESAYKEAYGEIPPQPFIDTAYDAAMLLMLAIEKAGSTEGEAVREALYEVSAPPGEEIIPGEWAKAKKLLAEGRQVDYTGAAGPMDFDEHGDIAGYFSHWVIEDGQIETVKVFQPKAPSGTSASGAE